MSPIHSKGKKPREGQRQGRLGREWYYCALVEATLEAVLLLHGITTLAARTDQSPLRLYNRAALRLEKALQWAAATPFMRELAEWVRRLWGDEGLERLEALVVGLLRLAHPRRSRADCPYRPAPYAGPAHSPVVSAKVV